MFRREGVGSFPAYTEALTSAGIVAGKRFKQALIFGVANAEGLSVARRHGRDSRAWNVNHLDNVVRVDQVNGVVALLDELNELRHV